jgi:enoyl-CoA hydratase / 3-hydroxyacyl-CoA dehydrogenase
MPVEEIQTVCFVGAGNMGCFNAAKAACSGYRVTLYDISEDKLQQARSRCEQVVAYLASIAYCQHDDIDAALGRMAFSTDLAEATADADLVSESVVERLDVKREVHGKLDQLCPARTILTTNSSYLLPSSIEDAVRRGDRFAAMHSYMGSPLVDIVGSRRTSADTIRVLESYVHSINAVPLVLKKEHPGYVLNAILGPVLATAMMLVAEGRGTVEQVDRAWMHYRSAPMGPLGIIDIIGLNLIYSGWENRREQASIPGLRPRVLALLSPYIERNELGMSTGKGFYRYPEPAFQVPGFAHGDESLEILYQPLMLALVASAIVVAAAGVAEPAEIDRAWMVGTSLDKGPFAVLEEVGPDVFIDAFEVFAAASGFNPDNARIVSRYFAEADNTRNRGA